MLTFDTVTILNFSHFSVWVGTPHCDFTFQVSNDELDLFMGLFAIHISSLMSCFIWLFTY